MPPRKVYGKSRAIYDPLAVFDSPQRQTPKVVKETKIDAFAPKLSRLAIQDGYRTHANKLERSALGEVNVNAKVLPSLPSRDKTEGRSKARKKIVVEDSDEEELEKQSNRAEQKHSVPSPRSVQPEEDNGVEDVTLFRDDHEFESHDVAKGDEEACQPLGRDEETAEQQQQQGSLGGTADFPIGPSTPAVQDEYRQHCSKLLELSLHGMSGFLDWSNELSVHFNIIKIAEASFSEVYRLLPLKHVPGLSSNDESVFKVIPLRPPDSTLPTEKRKRAAALKKGENMSLPDHVANEVKLLHRMSNIPGFTNFRDVRIVQGRPPKPFVKAFKEFNALQKAKRKQLSLFPDPAKKTSYADDQLWAVVEMQDAGMDLEQLVESGDCTSMWIVWDAFWQVALSLAKGEGGAEFEHRDLHLGNICVRMPSEQNLLWDPKRKLDLTGLETTIIDYTISRASMQDETIAYHDLAVDATLFEGDSTEEYQYDIYRYMRGAVFLDDPYADFSRQAQRKNRSWRQYHPITNLIWLHFVLYKLLEQVELPSATKAPPRKNKEEHAKWKRANDLEHVLLRVRNLLDPDQICQSVLESASDLVKLALTECWLDAEAIVGAQADETELVQQFEVLEVDAGAST